MCRFAYVVQAPGHRSADRHRGTAHHVLPDQHIPGGYIRSARYRLKKKTKPLRTRERFERSRDRRFQTTGITRRVSTVLVDSTVIRAYERDKRTGRHSVVVVHGVNRGRTRIFFIVWGGGPNAIVF